MWPVQMLFIVIDVTDVPSHVLNYFGVSQSDTPTARIIEMNTNKKFTLPSGVFTAASLRQLCQDVSDGTAQVNTHKQIDPIQSDSSPLSDLCCVHSRTTALTRSLRTGIKGQSKSWWGRTLTLSPRTPTKTCL